MGQREEFAVKLLCPKCGQHGTAIWEEAGPIYREKGPQRAIKFVSSGFSVDPSRMAISGDPEIVCDHCDEVQPD